jgi:hypothetical protein
MSDNRPPMNRNINPGMRWLIIVLGSIAAAIAIVFLVIAPEKWRLPVIANILGTVALYAFARSKDGQ